MNTQDELGDLKRKLDQAEKELSSRRSDLAKLEAEYATHDARYSRDFSNNEYRAWDDTYGRLSGEIEEIGQDVERLLCDRLEIRIAILRLEHGIEVEQLRGHPIR